MKVTIYTLPDCVQCDSTKRMFDRAGVEYESVDLNQDNDSLIYVKEVLGYSAAPVVVAGEKVWSGFRMSEIKNTIAEIDLEKGQEAK